MGLERFARSIEELTIYFASYASAVGFGAQDVNTGSSVGSDEKASRVHDSRIRVIDGAAYADKKRIETTILRISPNDYHWLRLAFEPTGDGQLGGPNVSAIVRREFGEKKKLMLFSVALHTPTTIREFARSYGETEEIGAQMAKESPNLVREWLLIVAQKQGERLQRIVAAAESAIVGPLERYGMAEREVISETRRVEDERKARESSQAEGTSGASSRRFRVAVVAGGVNLNEVKKW